MGREQGRAWVAEGYAVLREGCSRRSFARGGGGARVQGLMQKSYGKMCSGGLGTWYARGGSVVDMLQTCRSKRPEQADEGYSAERHCENYGQLKVML